MAIKFRDRAVREAINTIRACLRAGGVRLRFHETSCPHVSLGNFFATRMQKERVMEEIRGAFDLFAPCIIGSESGDGRFEVIEKDFLSSGRPVDPLVCKVRTVDKGANPEPDVLEAMHQAVVKIVTRHGLVMERERNVPHISLGLIPLDSQKEPILPSSVGAPGLPNILVTKQSAYVDAYDHPIHPYDIENLEKMRALCESRIPDVVDQEELADLRMRAHAYERLLSHLSHQRLVQHRRAHCRKMGH